MFIVVIGFSRYFCWVVVVSICGGCMGDCVVFRLCFLGVFVYCFDGFILSLLV